MTPSKLRDHALKEIEELGPEPSGPELELWREERWGAVVHLAGLADDDAELLRAAADQVATEWTDREVHAAVGCGDPSPRSAPEPRPVLVERRSP